MSEIADLARAHDEACAIAARRQASAKQLRKKGKGWPMIDECGLAVHPAQAEQFQSEADRAGLTGVKFRANGDVEISDRGQRAKYLELRGIVDRNGGYRETRNSNR